MSRSGSHRESTNRPYPAMLPPHNLDGEFREKWYADAGTARRCQKEAWRLYRKREGERAALLGTEAEHRFGKLNAAEQAFVKDAIANGSRPHRNGWPDFICETEQGIIGIEVKGRGDVLSAAQIQCFTMLEKANFTVYVWRPNKRLRHWREELEKQRGEALPTGALQTKAGNQGAYPQPAGQSEHEGPDGGESQGSSKAIVQHPGSRESSSDSPSSAIAGVTPGGVAEVGGLCSAEDPLA